VDLVVGCRGVSVELEEFDGDECLLTTAGGVKLLRAGEEPHE
jgi:hypothetical protein